mgnify:CR=1 FL=1
MVSSVSVVKPPRYPPWGEEGPYFEDFEVGMIIDHWPCRTLTEVDNIIWLSYTGDSNPLYFDKEYVKYTDYQRNPVHPLIVLNLTLALTVRDTSINSVAFLGAEYMRLLEPVYPGDTICVESEVTAKRESRSRPEAGIVTWIHRAYNQEGKLVAEIRRANLVYKREYSPWRKFIAMVRGSGENLRVPG